jgi:uncharacterized protein YecE (DUF72 family)
MNAARASNVLIGCAGWSIAKAYAQHFAIPGSHLQRYASQFTAVEVNSSFYRPHRPATYSRWAASVPAAFRFAVKIPREITHVLRLVNTETILDRFLAEAAGLGDRLGPLLVQMPPSLAFNALIAGAFFEALRTRFAGTTVCEPRHPSWFQPAVDRLLASLQVARAAADPAVVAAAAEPGGWEGLRYHRLHGSPRMYYSSYPPEYLDALRDRLASCPPSVPTWCIFDNTAIGAATANGLDILRYFPGPRE